MKSIGEFQKGEIGGKSFLILSQTYGYEGNQPRQPLFFCPKARVECEESKRSDAGLDPYGFLPVVIPPHFPNILSIDQQGDYVMEADSDKDLCKFTVLPLFWCNSKDAEDFHCGVCYKTKLGTDYYYCVSCDEIYHKECVETPLEIKHPSFPFLSLQLYSSTQIDFKCMCCGISPFCLIYHCPTSKLSMHPVCALKPIPFLIDHPKRHAHSLTFFPKQSSLACHVCGLIKEFIPTYVCVECVFVVHQDCIYFPYVIRIPRHHHRISFTYSLPPQKLLCGVCRKIIDNHYGAYSCNTCDGYFVHSRCAVRKDVWDGEELEGVPEEPEIVVEPFERIADGIILHFSHGHHLKLETSKGFDESKFCQGCILPIYEDSYYSCMDECSFILHEACANAPCKKYFPLYPCLITLTSTSKDKTTNVYCIACGQVTCGFFYEVPMSYDYGNGIRRLDLRCASISEPFEYQGHEHPLYLALTPEEEEAASCQICQKKGGRRKLSCIECNYVICFRCATLPYKARYKHDKHFLTFGEVKELSDQSSWCEVCEWKITDSRVQGFFYSCDDCCTTLHVECLLGRYPYAKPGLTIIYCGYELDILGNSTMSRAFCHGSKHRCSDKVAFKMEDMIFCSPSCSYYFDK